MIVTVWYWKRRGIVFLRGYDNACRFDIVWLEFEIWKTVSHIVGICDRRRYWGTPPQRYEVSVLGLWLVDGLQVTCLVYVICYLVGVSFCTYSTSSLALCCISSQIISAGLWEWHCSYRSSAVWWLVAYTFTSQWNGPRTTNDWARVDEIEKAIPTRTPSQAGRVKKFEESWGVNEVWVRDHAMLSATKS